MSVESSVVILMLLVLVVKVRGGGIELIKGSKSIGETS